MALNAALWPDAVFYDKQVEIVDSVENNDETYVVAGNALGKDWVASNICLNIMLRCIKEGKTCRIVTTSVKEDHIDVLWGEIGRWVSTCVTPLTHTEGGPLVVNNLQITRASERDVKNPYNYLKGMVAGDDMDALSGHHADVTLAVGDEASGLKDAMYNKMSGWMKRFLAFGNPHSCSNFWRRAIEAGDVPRDSGQGFHRKVIHIGAEDSPNVRIARAYIKHYNGSRSEARNRYERMLVPGVLTLEQLEARRKIWDEVQCCVKLDGKFYGGAKLLLYPVDWLDSAARRHRQLVETKAKRGPYGLGVDTADGGDNTAWAVCDELGLVELFSIKTPNTNRIPEETIRLMAKYSILPERVCFDKGSAGWSHCCRMVQLGYEVRSVAFGAKISLDPRAGRFPASKRREAKSEAYAYKNRRAQLFGELSEVVDPGNLDVPGGFAIPEGIMGCAGDPRSELRHQLAPMPKLYDKEGQLVMLPKSTPTIDVDPANPEVDGKTLVGLIGHSPDEADATVLALHALLHDGGKRRAGAAGYGLHALLS